MSAHRFVGGGVTNVRTSLGRPGRQTSGHRFGPWWCRCGLVGVITSVETLWSTAELWRVDGRQHRGRASRGGEAGAGRASGRGGRSRAGSLGAVGPQVGGPPRSRRRGMGGLAQPGTGHGRQPHRRRHRGAGGQDPQGSRREPVGAGGSWRDRLGAAQARDRRRPVVAHDRTDPGPSRAAASAATQPLSTEGHRLPDRPGGGSGRLPAGRPCRAPPP